MDKEVKHKILKTVSYLLQGLAVLLFAYLVALPFIPEVAYRVNNPEKKAEIYNSLPESATVEEKIEVAKEVAATAVQKLDPKAFEVSQNRLVISKIGVNTPIVESKNSDYGLSLGAWHVPESSTPDKGSNTVITGHRFKYLPPSNLTFYLLHKLEKNDIISVLWKGEYYFYQIRETKIVEPTAVEILDPTDDSILTLYTCDPIYSQKHRLVVVAELMGK